MKSLLPFTVLIALAVAPGVRADTIYYFTADGCSGGCGTLPFATIDLKQTNSTTITAKFTLASNEAFAKTGAGKDTALAFTVNGAAPTVNILPGSKPASSDYTVGGPVTLPKYGDFGITILCSGCANGGKITNPAGPLEFTVSRASGISVSDFSLSKNGKPDAYFASDILGNNGNTGIVAALHATPTPEPGYQLVSFAMLGLAGVFGRRKLLRKS